MHVDKHFGTNHSQRGTFGRKHTNCHLVDDTIDHELPFGWDSNKSHFSFSIEYSGSLASSSLRLTMKVSPNSKKLYRCIYFSRFKVLQTEAFEAEVVQRMEWFASKSSKYRLLMKVRKGLLVQRLRNVKVREVHEFSSIAHVILTQLGLIFF